jgi:hypothetical protein
VKPTKKNGGLYVVQPKGKAGAYCVGLADMPDDDGAGCGAAPCEQWICLDETGVAGVGDLGNSSKRFGVTPPQL